MNFNLTVLAGHLVRDPELRYTQNQTAVANFDIAVNYKSGSYEDTSFISCSAFGNTAENIVKYFVKGKPIFITGRIQQDTWQAQDGSNRSKIKIIVSQFKFVGGGSNKQQNMPSNQQATQEVQTNTNPNW